jgi:hypothetical protein
VYPVEAAEFALGGDQLGDSQNGSSVEIDDPVLSGAASNFVATNSGVQYSFSPTALTITQGFDRVEQRVDVGVLVRLAVSEPVPSRIGRRSIRRARSHTTAAADLPQRSRPLRPSHACCCRAGVLFASYGPSPNWSSRQPKVLSR